MIQDNLYLAIKNYINQFTGLGLVKIFPAYQNRVPLPSDNDYAIVTIYNQTRLGTPSDDYDGTNITVSQDYQASIQIDFYGSFAFSYATAIINVSRDITGCDYLAQYGVQPLFCDEARNLTVVSGEKQYVNRFTVEMNVDYNSAVDVVQDGFDTAQLNLLRSEK